MKIYVASDHAGFELKEHIKKFLASKDCDVEDCGAALYDSHDDYPDFIAEAAKKVSANPKTSMGIIFGGTGQGEAMTANKFKNVRCALFYGPKMPLTTVDVNGKQSSDPFEIITLARHHNDANVLSISARFVSQEDAETAVRMFLETRFSDEERHTRRINKIATIEEER